MRLEFDHLQVTVHAYIDLVEEAADAGKAEASEITSTP
jgi:hypothetical protein